MALGPCRYDPSSHESHAHFAAHHWAIPSAATARQGLRPPRLTDLTQGRPQGATSGVNGHFRPQRCAPIGASPADLCAPGGRQIEDHDDDHREFL
jgi:hypothetical protein